MPQPGDEQYLHGHHDSVLAVHGARTAADSCAYLLPYLEPGMSVLDIGFGPGSITADLAELVSPGQVTGVEAAPAAVAAATELLTARGITNATLMTGSIYDLPFGDDEFDVVHCHQVLQYLADPAAALAEMARVAKRVVAVREVDYDSIHWAPANQGMSDWLAGYRAAAKARGGEPNAGRHLRAWANSAGLAELGQLELSTSTTTFATTERTSWWGESQAIRVLESDQYDSLRGQGYSDEQVRQIAAAWRDWGAHPDAYLTMVQVELLLLLDQQV